MARPTIKLFAKQTVDLENPDSVTEKYRFHISGIVSGQRNPTPSQSTFSVTRETMVEDDGPFYYSVLEADSAALALLLDEITMLNVITEQYNGDDWDFYMGNI